MKKQEAKKIAGDYLKKAYKYQASGQLDEATQHYKRSIDLYPTAEAHTFLGWTYSFRGQYDDAISECQKAIEVDPTFGNPYNDIGAYLIEKGKYKEAIPWLKKATVAKRYDSYCYPFYNLGRVYEHQGDWRRALQFYQKSVKANHSYLLGIKALNRVLALYN